MRIFRLACLLLVMAVACTSLAALEFSVSAIKKFSPSPSGNSGQSTWTLGATTSGGSGYLGASTSFYAHIDQHSTVSASVASVPIAKVRGIALPYPGCIVTFYGHETWTYRAELQNSGYQPGTSINLKTAVVHKKGVFGYSNNWSGNSTRLSRVWQDAVQQDLPPNYSVKIQNNPGGYTPWYRFAVPDLTCFASCTTGNGCFVNVTLGADWYLDRLSVEADNSWLILA